MFEFTRIKKQKPPAAEPAPSGLEFTVMPNTPEKLAVKRPIPATKNPQIVPPERARGSLRMRRILLLSIGVLLLAGLATGAYYWFSAQQKPEPKGDIDIDIPFSSGASKEPKPADADNDGLADAREKEIGADIANPDTDTDGLADGDEVNIYASDPLLADTDGDKFPDGREVSGGYSPVINSTNKAAPEELALWQDRIKNFELHEPTKTTLKSTASGTSAPSSNLYQNKLFNYQITVPSLLAYREADGGDKVGFFVAGTVPPDEGIENDPLRITQAVKDEGANLKDFVQSLYAPSDISRFDEVIINGITAVKVATSADRCIEQHVFYAKADRIFIFTLGCTNSADFENFFNQMHLSFKFN